MNAAAASPGQWASERAVAGPWLAHRHVGAYVLRRELATALRSIVHLAKDSRTGRAVALKVAKRAALRAAGFAREFAFQASITHPRVAEVFEHGVDGDVAFLAMEHAEGGALPLEGGRVPEREVFDRLEQIAGALAALHVQGVVHRDLKPTNLLVRADGSLALSDFGSACRVDATVDGLPRLVGSPRYAAPEQLQGAAPAPSADVYSVGVLLVEWLRGAPPFNGQSLAELLAQHLVAPVPRLEAGLQHWQPLVDALLAKKQAQRLADGAAVLAALRALGGRFHPASAASRHDTSRRRAQ